MYTLCSKRVILHHHGTVNYIADFPEQICTLGHRKTMKVSCEKNRAENLSYA